MTAEIEPELRELQTRYIKDRKLRPRVDDQGNHYAIAAVFLPDHVPSAGREELSVFGIDGLSETDIWQLGFDHYLPSGRALRGRADAPSSAFLDAGLSYIPQRPPPRHGSFVDWPGESERQLAIAVDLSAKAKVRPHPDGATGPRKP